VSVAATSKAGGSNSCSTTPGWGVRRRFPPLQRAQIVELACLEPIAEGLHITHWTPQELARQAVADGIGDAISPRTVQRILHDVDLQPHRTRYWKTARLDRQFKERAEQVLGCYGNAERLARRGLWTVAVDEVPNFQVLERHPLRRAIPGSIEQQEFEYTRHGTVNLLLFLVVHSGRMEVAVEAKKDAAHYREALKEFRRRHRGLHGVFLVQDGDPSHTAGDTAAYWSSCRGWWRPRFTPVHASWLNQAELLIRAFGHRYLKRGCWRTREEFIEHVVTSAAEYNRLYAHPFAWTWTNQKMRQWFAKHAPEFVA
jgi:DDE superfamily endonuclease/Homeodomain-like domain